MKLVNQDLDAAEKHYETSQEQTDEEKLELKQLLTK